MYRFIVLFMGVVLSLAAPGCGQKEPARVDDGRARIERAFHNQESDFFVTAEGEIENILPDDRRGVRHQRFIVRVAPEQTVLIAHNIDIAPRISDVQEGDEIIFRGEYEWNEKGGVIHWTHHDPLMKRQGGWIEHKGRRYQ